MRACYAPNSGARGDIPELPDNEFRACVQISNRDCEGTFDFWLRALVDLGGFIPCPDHRLPPNAEWDLTRYYCDEMRRVFG